MATVPEAAAIRGLPGPEGPQGSQGPRGLAAATSVVRVTADVDHLSLGLQSVSVSCPAGTVAAAGGYSFTGIGAAYLPPLGGNAPVGGSRTTGPTGWVITIPVTGSLKAIRGATVTVYADCS